MYILLKDITSKIHIQQQRLVILGRDYLLFSRISMTPLFHLWYRSYFITSSLYQ